MRSDRDRIYLSRKILYTEPGQNAREK